MDGGAWWAAGSTAKSWTWLSNFTFTFHFHALEKAMATHSSVLAWRIPGMGEPGGLPSVGSHRVEHDWSDLAAAAAEVDEPRACYTEWSQSERGKQILYIKAFIQTWEKWYWWTYLQERNGDADAENGLMDTEREGEDGTNGESSIVVYTQSRVKWITGEKLPGNTESPAWHSVMS